MCSPHRADIFEEPGAVVVEIKDTLFRGIQSITAAFPVKLRHGFFNFGFHGAALGFVVEGPMLKDDVLPLRHIHQKHPLRDKPCVIRAQPDTVALRQRDSPAADPSRGCIDPAHQLSGTGILLISACIVQFAGNAVQQAADRLAVTARNCRLLLPEVPVADAFIIADVQIFVRRNGHKVNFHIFPCLFHLRSSMLCKIAVEGPQDGP